MRSYGWTVFRVAYLMHRRVQGFAKEITVTLFAEPIKDITNGQWAGLPPAH